MAEQTPLTINLGGDGKLGGGELVTEVQRLLTVLAGNRKGNTRPSDVQTSELWLDDSNDPLWYLKLWTGVADITVLSINSGTDSAVVPVAAGGTGASSAAAALVNLGIVFGTAVGNVVQVQTGNKLPALDASDLLAVPGDVITTKGDLIIGDSEGSPIRFAAGTDGQMLYYHNGTLVTMAAGAEGQAVIFNADNLPVAGDIVAGEWTEETVIDVATETPATTIEFVGLDMVNYDWRMRFHGLRGAGTALMTFQMGYGATPTWVVGWVRDGAAFPSGASNETVANLQSSTTSTADGEIIVIIPDNGVTAYPTLFFDVVSVSSGNLLRVNTSGRFVGSTQPTAMRLSAGTNIVDGMVVLEKRERTLPA